MDVNEFKKKLFDLSGVLSSPQVANNILTPPALALEIDVKKRVYQDGIATNGTTFGTYSTKPIYVNPSNLQGLPASRIKPVGKTGKTEFSDGAKHKSKYYGRGYREFRQDVGRQNQKVDFNLTGSNRIALQTGVRGNKLVLGYISESEARKMEQLEKKYGDAVIPTTKEKETLKENVQLEVVQIFKTVL